MFNRRTGNTSTLAVVIVVIVLGLVVWWLVSTNNDENIANKTSTSDAPIEGTTDVTAILETE